MRQHDEDNSAVVMVNSWFPILLIVGIVEEGMREWGQHELLNDI